MPIDEIHKVCFVGAGTMGCYNSLVAAISGYQVVLFDQSEEVLQQVTERHGEWGPLLVGGGYCSEQELAAAKPRITVEPDLARAVADADLVSESIFEQIDIKREIHARLDEACPERTLLTSNSSALLVSDLEDVVSRGDKFAALHSHIGSALFDIVGGPRTSASVISRLVRYVESLGCVPLVQHKEHPGYVLNAMLGPLLAAALRLVIKDGLTIEQVDRAWMVRQAAPMGPFGMMDLFGLNVIHDSWQQSKPDAYRQQLQPAVLALLKPYMDEGQLGIKSGAGFYQYPEPAYQASDFQTREASLPLAENGLLTTLISSAVLIAAKGVTEAKNVDMAWTVGTHLATGPLATLESIGHKAFEGMLSEHEGAGRINKNDARVVREYLRTVYSQT
ncbi:MAG: 3-hydroxyacyl-CoA dehydrogenase NAD-binding domain-containing protein [Halieaceae bacterium]